MSVNSKMTAIADAIRSKTGGTGSLTLDEMADAIDGIEIGVELPTLTNEGSASDLLSGKQLIDQEGNIVTGAITAKTASNLTASGAVVTVPAGYYAAQATKSVSTATQATPSITVDANGLITATATQDAGYVVSGTKNGTKQLAFQPAKTITPSTASQIAVSGGYYTGGNITVAAVPTQTKSATPTSSTQNITPDSGKFLSGVTVNAIPSTYVKPTSTKAAATYTPSTANQTIAAGTYCSGAQTIKGDSNLKAGNIKSGVSIFGVSGSYVGDTSIEDGLVTGTLSSYFNDRISKIGTGAFIGCYYLEVVSFPRCETILASAFQGCNELVSVSFPTCTHVQDGAFSKCTKLSSINFPSCTYLGLNAFQSCTSLTMASFPMCENIRESVFYGCTNLTEIYLLSSSICYLRESKVFGNTAITSTTGSIYVPSSLVASYQAATNWAYFSSRIVAYKVGPAFGGGDN